MKMEWQLVSEWNGEIQKLRTLDEHFSISLALRHKSRW
jgi:hypothetical protein